ncbi:whirlin-like isoform X2 [Limulus polyphemus]|uniref:Whirlin-like isoform X2 n=1 Tax=Limulus polyphemus TaxID=6850 RepID=A0ABM1SC46_LIMPO|nr:whirlin-like isoform X2 [Limulus polyphemus]
MSIWSSDSESQDMAGFSTELLHIPGSEINKPSTSRNTSGSRRSSPRSSLRYRSPSPTNSSSHVGGTHYKETTLVDEHLTTAITDSAGRTNSPQTPLVRRVSVKPSRHSDDDIGVGLSGGKENGQGIFVSSVKKGSGADRSGLNVGDQILAINNISFSDFTLQEAINILYSAKRKVQLTVIPSRSQETTHNVDLLHYLWMDSEGRPVSPLMDLAYDSSHHRGIGGRDNGIRTVTLNVEKGLPLGLLIRGGMEDGLGIFVTGVDNPSAADLAGLRVGDQILSVNDKSFKSIRHDEAVDILKFSPRMTMTVRFVGKVPHACTPYSGQSWYQDHQQLSSPRLSRRGSSRKREKPRDLETISTSPTEEAEKILDHRAQQVLTENEKISLAYYCNEYETRAMTVDAFVAVLMELLENPEKYLLMTHIRGIVRREDLDKFDDLIYKREIQTIKKEAHSPRGSFRKMNVSHHHRLTVPDHLTPHKEEPPAKNGGTSSQDSDVDVVNGNMSMYGMSKSASSRLQVSDNHRKFGLWKYSRLLPRHSLKSDTKGTNPATLLRRLTLRRHSSGGEGVNPEERRVSSRVTEERRWSLGSELLETHENDKPESRPVSSVQRERKSPNLPSFNGTQENFSNWLQVPHTRVRRHRSLPDPHAICARKHQQLQLPLHQHRSASMRLPGHRATPEPNGRLRIVIKKTRPLLGIAIEGGVNTGQPLPRIISIHASGAAFEAGGLKVGHIILEVNGFKTSKMEHRQVAQLIAESFYNSDSDQLELLVMEKAKTELEIRRSSFMVLE